jgi:hypothetical protein
MAKGGSSQPVKQEITQSTLPEYARPYFEGLMQRAGTSLTTPYQAYDQERIAGFTPEQQQVQQNIMGQQTPGQFGDASTLASVAGLGSLQAGQYAPSRFYAGRAQAGPLNYFQMQGPESFTQQGAAQQYMSPFIQQALEPQMREAITSARRGQVAQDLGSARQGTYGGSRQLLAGMERERNLGQQLGDIQSRGMQTAFEQAQGQFNAEQQARQNAGIQNLQAALGVQSLGSGQNMQAQLANQQSGLEAQRMAEQSRQFGSQQGLAGLAQAGQMGQTLANIGSAQSQADQARFGLQTSTAAQQQALNQQYLDTAYQDFLRQRDYPMEQLQQYSSLLRGVPVTPSSTTSTYGQQPGIGQQLLGAGLGAASIYKTFGGA